MPAEPNYFARAEQAVACLSDEQRLSLALQDIQGGASQRQAADDWQVPRSTLQRRLKGGRTRATNGGNNTKLNAVEDLALLASANTELSIGIVTG